jgi:hypothetical protein
MRAEELTGASVTALAALVADRASPRATQQ